MQQLVLNGLSLPEQTADRYSAHPAELAVQLTMIAGNIVKEIRGHVWQVSYAADYLPPQIWRQLAAILRSGQTIAASFLPDDGDEMISDTMVVTSLTDPSYAFSVRGGAAWHNLSFTLRSVNPYD